MLIWIATKYLSTINSVYLFGLNIITHIKYLKLLTHHERWLRTKEYIIMKLPIASHLVVTYIFPSMQILMFVRGN